MSDDTSYTLSRILGCETWRVVLEVEELLGRTSDLDVLVKEGLTHPSLQEARQRIAREMAPHTGRYRTAIQKAFKKGLGWSISEDEYNSLVEMPCSKCGADELGGGVGLVRVDSSIGFTFDNVLPCCGSCSFGRAKVQNPTESD